MYWEKKFDQIDRELESLFIQLANYPTEQLNAAPRPGKWSVMQILEHLYLAESLALKYLRKKLSYDTKLRPADWRTTLKVFWMTIYTRIPIPFPAPGNVATDKLPTTSEPTELMQRYRALRKETRAFFQEQPEEVIRSEVFRHPFSGRIDIRGTIIFFREHFRRHRRQIRRAVGRLRQI